MDQFEWIRRQWTRATSCFATNARRPVWPCVACAGPHTRAFRAIGRYLGCSAGHMKHRGVSLYHLEVCHFFLLYLLSFQTRQSTAFHFIWQSGEFTRAVLAVARNRESGQGSNNFDHTVVLEPALSCFCHFTSLSTASPRQWNNDVAGLREVLRPVFCQFWPVLCTKFNPFKITHLPQNFAMVLCKYSVEKMC